jgi:hypothetical protein
LLDPHDAAAEWLHPCLLQVRTLDSDSPTFWDIRQMSAEEQQLRETAMNQELANLVQRDTFSLVPRSSVPKDAQIVPCQWVLKKKWRPDLTLIKYKARLCLSGNRQQLPDDKTTPTLPWPIGPAFAYHFPWWSRSVMRHPRWISRMRSSKRRWRSRTTWPYRQASPRTMGTPTKS